MSLPLNCQLSAPSLPKDDYITKMGWSICLGQAWPAKLTLLGRRYVCSLMHEDVVTVPYDIVGQQTCPLECQSYPSFTMLD